MSDKFEDSLKNGNHLILNRLQGNWKGISRVWFEPGKLADESEIRGMIKPVLGGRFLLHEYETMLENSHVEGISIFGYDINQNRFQCAWIDSFHNGTSIMISENNQPISPFSVLGHYGPDPQWGWRTILDHSTKDTLIITMNNIAPGGMDEKAVEIIYKRI